MYLTNKDLKEKFDYIYDDLRDVNEDNIFLQSDILRKINSINIRKYGNTSKELSCYIFEPFKLSQPNTYKVLASSEVKFYYAVEKARDKGFNDYTELCFCLNNKVYYVMYTEKPYEKRGNGLILSDDYIPVPILNSWFFRTHGFHIANKMPPCVFRSQLPTTHLRLFVEIIFPEKEKKHKKEFDFLTDKFKKTFVTSANYQKYCKDEDSYFCLRCLLDTREEEDYGLKGYQVFLRDNPDKGPELYVTQNADPYTIKRLVDPVHVIDLYGAHVFSGKEPNEFNFMQYAEDF